MHEWKQHAWSDTTWEWLKPYLGNTAVEPSMLRSGVESEREVPLRELLWRYQNSDLSYSGGSLPFSAKMTPVFAARALLEAQGLDDSREAAEEALATEDGVFELFKFARSKRWTGMAYVFLPVGGDILTSILAELTSSGDAKYLQIQAQINLNLLQHNPNLTAADREKVEDAYESIPQEPPSPNTQPVRNRRGYSCSSSECINHFQMVNDGERQLQSLRGSKLPLFLNSLHCSNCDPPAWNLARLGILLEETFERLDARYAAVARALLPFMGHRFAYLKENLDFAEDVPGEWVLELLNPSAEEAGEAYVAFRKGMQAKYPGSSNPGGATNTADLGAFDISPNWATTKNSASPLMIPKRGIV